MHDETHAFTPLFDWLDDVDGMTHEAQRLYGVLWRMRGEDGTCAVSTRDLSLAAGTDERNLLRRLRMLERSGVVLIDRSGAPMGKPNVYAFPLHPRVTD